MNDLAEKGYKFKKLGEAQMNLLMAYDVNTGDFVKEPVTFYNYFKNKAGYNSLYADSS